MSGLTFGHQPLVFIDTTPKHNGSNGWQGVLLYKGFTLLSTKDTFFGGGQNV